MTAVIRPEKPGVCIHLGVQPALLKCWPSYHFRKVEKGGWLLGDVFLCSCYETKTSHEGMLPVPIAGIMLLIGERPPEVRGLKGCCQLLLQG